MCPPGVDQTMRTSQIWQIFAPTSCITVALPTNDLEDLTRHGYGRQRHYPICLFQKPWGAWNCLARPNTTRRTNPRTHTMTGVGSRKLVSRLEALPAELISTILADSDLTKGDLLRLGLASRSLWHHLLKHIELQNMQSVATLAGQPIACMGSYLESLPKAFESEGLFEKTVDYSGSHWGFNCPARAMYWKASNQYRPFHGSDQEWIQEWDDLEVNTNFLSERRATLMRTELLDTFYSIYEGNGATTAWVLRNLDTMEYVRCRPQRSDSDITGLVDNESIDLTIDDVMLLKMCHTQGAPMPTPRPPRYSRLGPDLAAYRSWPGHRFDIVPREEDDQTKSQVLESLGWKDITETVVSEVKEVIGNLTDLTNITKTRFKRSLTDATESEEASITKRRRASPITQLQVVDPRKIAIAS